MGKNAYLNVTTICESLFEFQAGIQNSETNRSITLEKSTRGGHIGSNAFLHEPRASFHKIVFLKLPLGFGGKLSIFFTILLHDLEIVML